MDKSNDGLRNPYKKLKEIFEKSRYEDSMMQDLDEDKLLENLLIFVMQLEHQSWFLGYRS